MSPSTSGTRTGIRWNTRSYRRNAALAEAVVTGSTVMVTGVAKGRATVTVTSRDPEGLSAEQRFGVAVPNRAPGAVGTIADLGTRARTCATGDDPLPAVRQPVREPWRERRLVQRGA